MNAHPKRTPALGLALLLGLAAFHWSAATSCAEDALATVADEQFRGLPVGAIVASGNDRTREEIVLQELLMQPGDPYEPELARESERNLRALPFLGSARVIPRPDDNGGVRLEVTVTERFPWIGGALPSFGGGKFELDLAVGTGNFLGRGQLLGFRTFQSTEVEPSYYLAFAEPRVAGSRWPHHSTSSSLASTDRTPATQASVMACRFSARLPTVPLKLTSPPWTSTEIK